MALAAGTRLGPYEIVAALGAGGMGEVYQARDTRLDRTVAIKVLPAELSTDPERRARFEREARTVAALNHPHICTLHDVGEAEVALADLGRADLQVRRPERVTYLVMEHLAGETLAQRLRKGAVPVPQAIDLGAQIAEALDAAHKHGIVHRDLKPANVMLTTGGAGRSGVTSAKLLDFGLAKSRPGGAIRLVPDSSAATQIEDVTVAGTLVGTIPYMAPEQVEGREADARTDLWALGCLLYEMVTGQRAFAGETPGSLIGAILAKEPEPLSTRQPLTPPALERLVTRCLAKDPDQRWDSAHDVADELRWMAGAATEPAARWRDVSPWRRRLGVAVGFLVGATVTAVAAVGWVRTREVAPRRVVRFAIEVPAGRDIQDLAMSPDGNHLAYVGDEGGRTRLYVRALHEATDRALAGTEGANSPFFSPDGGSIAFFAGATLQKVALGGGAPARICTLRSLPKSPVASDLRPMGTWGDDGAIVFAAATTGLFRVPWSGGEAVTVTQLDTSRAELGHAAPTILPDGRTLLFSSVVGIDYEEPAIVSVSVDGGARQVVVARGRAPRFLKPGYLLYGTEAGLNVVQFDLRRASARGSPVLVADDMKFHGWMPLYAISRAGDLSYVVVGPEPSMNLLRVDLDGRAARVMTLPPGFRHALSVSPDGRRLLAYRTEGRVVTLWTLDVERRVLTKVAGEGIPHAGVWSPDGTRMAFSSNRTGVANIFVQAADGSGPAERVVPSEQHQDPGSWSRDGRWIAYAQVDSRNGWDLWAVDVATRKAMPIRRTPAQEHQPAISPDGRWIAYQSNDNGRFDVYVEGFPAGGNRLQVSPEGGTEPTWAADGRRIFYRAGPSVMSVRVTPGTVLSADVPTRLFEGAFAEATSFGPPGYAVSPDGRAFYFLQSVDETPAPQRINVVLGWLEELRQRIRGE